MLLLIRTVTQLTINRNKPPYHQVVVLGSHSDHQDDFARSLAACEQFVQDESFDEKTEVGGLLNTMRRFGMTTAMPKCGPGQEQSEPNMVWQKTYNGRDVDGAQWIVSYTVVRV